MEYASALIAVCLIAFCIINAQHISKYRKEVDEYLSNMKALTHASQALKDAEAENTVSIGELKKRLDEIEDMAKDSMEENIKTNRLMQEGINNILGYDARSVK